jgi:hypothetical protein
MCGSMLFSRTGWILTRTTNFRVRKFGAIDPDVPYRHHDAIEFPEGNNALVTQLAEGQRGTVLQLPVVHQPTEHAPAEAPARTPLAVG